MSLRSFSFLRFMLVFTVILGGVHWYVWRRLIVSTGFRARIRVAAALIYSLLIGIFLLGGMGGRFIGGSPAWARWTANIYFGVLGLLFITLVAADLLVLGRRLWRRSGPSGSPDSPERRQFLARATAGAAAAVAAGLSGVALYEGLRRVRVKPVEVTLDKLARAHDGYRITQISDVHIGPTLGKDFLEEVVEGVLSTTPNLIVITGDLVDGDVPTLAPLLEPLRKLSAPDGVFFCTGNHEYYAGHKQWLAYLPHLGIRPLQNERVRLSAFELGGVPDYSAKEFPGALEADIAEVATGRDPSLPLVLLAHQPRHFYEAIDSGIDLQLAGHTHGGQMFPMTVLIHLMYPFIAGLYRRQDSQIYVSQGTGYWGPPMRLATRAEITQITLRAKG